MKLFGHKSFFSKVGHEIEKGIKESDKWMRKVFGDNTEIYVGAKSTNDGQNFEPNVKINYDNSGNISRPTPTKPAGYSRTTAATAKDIAQGGMTKDEVIEFNMKHPNETAMGVAK